MAYYWAKNFHKLLNEKASDTHINTQNSKDLPDQPIAIDEGFGRPYIVDPSPLNETVVANLMRVLDPFVAFSLQDMDWNNFPYNWIENSPQSTLFIPDRATNFFRTGLIGQSLQSIAKRICSFSENQSDLVHDCEQWCLHIYCFLSASNWSIVRQKLQLCIKEAVKAPDEELERMNLGVLVSLESCLLNNNRVIDVLSGILPLLQCRVPKLRPIQKRGIPCIISSYLQERTCPLDPRLFF
jgi:hypothetical protein